MEKTTPRPSPNTMPPIKKVVIDNTAIPSLRFFTNSTGSIIVNAPNIIEAQETLAFYQQKGHPVILGPINDRNIRRVAETITKGEARLYTNDEDKGLVSAVSPPLTLAEFLQHLVKTEPTDPRITPKIFDGHAEIRKKDGAHIYRPRTANNDAQP